MSFENSRLRYRLLLGEWLDGGVVEHRWDGWKWIRGRAATDTHGWSTREGAANHHAKVRQY